MGSYPHSSTMNAYVNLVVLSLFLAAVSSSLVDQTDCEVGPSGEKVCKTGTYGADGKSKVEHAGNVGAGLTGSNGNAAPLNVEGQAYDPAAETYKKQIEAYQVWEKQQVENAKKQLGTAGTNPHQHGAL